MRTTWKRVRRRGGKFLAASTSPTLLLLLPGRIYPFTSLYLSLFLYRSFDQGNGTKKQVQAEVKMRYKIHGLRHRSL